MDPKEKKQEEPSLAKLAVDQKENVTKDERIDILEES